MRWTWAAALTAAAVVALAAPRAAYAQQDPPAPAGRAATVPADRDAARARTVGTEVPELLDTLLDADTPPGKRDEAARRLVSRQSDEARAALRQVVTSAGVSQDSRVAALRALADDPNPSPRLLNDLIAMLNEGNDRIVAAAAEALAGYKRSPQVVEALSALARDGKRARLQREAAARALGRLPEQPAAAALVAIVTNPEEIPELVAVAADALVEMTGLEANGRDPGRWGQWLKQNGSLPPGEWARALLPARAAREDRIRHQAEESIAAIDRLLRLQYDETPNENRPRMLLRYLNDPSPEVRRVGARKANEVSALPDAAEQITEPVELRLVELTGDADPGVRLDAVRALENTPVDQALLLAVLLPQLRVESDPNVRQAIVRKLSRARVDQPKELGQILDELARLLDDASPGVVRESAIAIFRLVTRAPAMLKQDPALARRIADRLRATMQRLAGQGGFQDARVECGRALAAFKDPQSRAFARELLNPRREPPAIRTIALVILGELGPPTADITVAVDNDPDRGVKVAGIGALARTSSFESAVWLAPRMNDPDPLIREAASDTYRKLLPAATPETLAIEADRRKANPALRVDILKVLLEKLTKAGNTGADAAAVNQNIGSNYLRDLNRPDLAVPYLRDALEQYRGAGWTLNATETLRDNLIKAMLQSRQYTQLAAMGQRWIGGASDEAAAATYRREIGLGIRNEAERLLTAYRDQSGPKWQENLNYAAAVVDAGLKMEPPLEDRIRQDLTKLEAEVRDRAARSPAAR